MTQIFCHEDNIAEFNAALREHAELRAFAAALHKAGMIDGLRGCRLRQSDDPDQDPRRGVTPALSDEAERRINDAHWARSQGKKP